MILILEIYCKQTYTCVYRIFQEGTRKVLYCFVVRSFVFEIQAIEVSAHDFRCIRGSLEFERRTSEVESRNFDRPYLGNQASDCETVKDFRIPFVIRSLHAST